MTLRVREVIIVIKRLNDVGDDEVDDDDVGDDQVDEHKKHLPDSAAPRRSKSISSASCFSS